MNPTASATGGQVPAGDGANAGQVPQANNNGGNTPQAPASQAPQAGGDHTQQPQQAGQQPSLTPAQYEAMIAELRKEAASHRTKASDFEKQLKALQDASLTADQKRDRDFAEMQTRDIERELTLQQLYLENAGFRLGPSLGIADIGAALALVQSEHRHDLAFDEQTGQPKNLDKLLAEVVKNHPILAATQPQPGQGQQPGGRPPVQSGPPMNPPRGNAQPTQPARTPAQMRRLDQVEWST